MIKLVNDVILFLVTLVLQLSFTNAQNCSSVGITPLLPMVGPDWGGFSLLFNGSFNHSLIYGVRYLRPDVPSEGILRACYVNSSATLLCGASGRVAGSSVGEFWHIMLVTLNSGGQETTLCKDFRAFRFAPMRFPETWTYTPVVSNPWTSSRVFVYKTGTEYYFTNKTLYRCLWSLNNIFSTWPPIAESDFTRVDKETGFCDTPAFSELAVGVSLPLRAVFFVVGTDGYTSWQQTKYERYDFIGKTYWTFLEEEITGHSPLSSPTRENITVYGKNLKQYMPDDYEYLYPIKYALSFENGYFYLLSAQCEYVNSTQLNCMHNRNTMHPGEYPLVLLMVYPDGEEYFIYASTFTLESKPPVVEEPAKISQAENQRPFLLVSFVAFLVCFFSL